VHNYNFVDVNPVNGVNYYQLKQVDYNGTNTLVGKTLAITFGNNLSEFKVSSNGNTLKVFSSVNKTGLTNFVITDLQGKTVAQVSKVLDKGYNSFSIDVSSLKTGVFVAQMRNENEYKIAKFIKE
jgi:V8-like Glu-specific endopeptidase